MNKTEYYNKNQTFARPASLEKIGRLYDFKNSTPLKILDIGCGDGKIGKELITFGHQIFGLDISEEAVEKAKQNGLSAQVFDAEKPLPFSDNEFDAVIACDILEHLFSPLSVIKEINRVLKNDGFFIGVIPNHFDLRNRFRLFFGKGMVNWDHQKYANGWNYAHLRFPTLKEIRKALKKNGFFAHCWQLNFQSGGLIPARLTPKFIRLFLLRNWPAVFSGKFGWLAKKNKPVKKKLIYISKTPLGL